MSSKEEKDHRRKILKEIEQKAKDEFENSLPIGRYLFETLFNHLNLELSNKSCNHSLQLTEAFLQTNGIENIEEVKRWLAEFCGYCDCEVLANIEEAFGK